MSGCVYNRAGNGYYTNRYGRVVPYEVLMWADGGTGYRRKGPRKDIIHHYSTWKGVDQHGNNIYRISGRRYSRSGASTGYILGRNFMQYTKGIVFPKVEREMKNYVYEHTIREAKAHGCII